MWTRTKTSYLSTKVHNTSTKLNIGDLHIYIYIATLKSKRGRYFNEESQTSLNCISTTKI